MLCLVHIQVGSLLYNYGQQGMEKVHSNVIVHSKQQTLK